MKDVLKPGVPHTAAALRSLVRLVSDACKAERCVLIWQPHE